LNEKQTVFVVRCLRISLHPEVWNEFGGLDGRTLRREKFQKRPIINLGKLAGLPDSGGLGACFPKANLFYRDASSVGRRLLAQSHAVACPTSTSRFIGIGARFLSAAIMDSSFSG
jgi:hypothetical protein